MAVQKKATGWNHIAAELTRGLRVSAAGWTKKEELIVSDLETEIEITDEMVMAAIRALPYLPAQTLGTLQEGTLVSEVYRAMCMCALQDRLSHQENSGRHEPHARCS